KRLSTTALSVRAALLATREPMSLLFRELPVACGLPVINTDSTPEIVEGFIETLRIAIDELRQAYLLLRDRMRTTLADFFGASGYSEAFRESLSERANIIAPSVVEMQLKAFCLRLADVGLAEAEWLDSVGSLVCALPPQKWSDLDSEKFVQELGLLAARFKRVESISFKRKRRSGKQSGVRIAITKADGSEIDEVIFCSKAEEMKISQLEDQVSKLVGKTKNVGLAATARVLWSILQKQSKPQS